MRKVLKPDFKVNIHRFSFFLCQLIMGQFQALLCQPSLWSGMEGFVKVPFKSGKASSCQVAEFLQRHIVDKILFHETGKVNFAGLFEIGKHIVNFAVNQAKNTDGLL